MLHQPKQIAATFGVCYPKSTRLFTPHCAPAISLLVSTISTASPRPPRSGGRLRMRERSLSSVVLPVPGLPNTSSDCALQTHSRKYIYHNTS